MAAITDSSPVQPQAPVGRPATPDVYIYLTVLCVFVLTPGSVVYTPLQHIYKDQLHLSAADTTTFKFIINIPGMAAFILGVMRDRFNPLRMGDRGFLVVFGFAACAVMLVIDKAPLTVYTLGAGLMLWSVATNMIGAAFNAIMRNVAEARMMTGRMSTLYNGLSSGIGCVALLAGGWLSDHVPWRTMLLAVIGLYAFIALIGFWKPTDVLHNTGSDEKKDISMLMKETRQLFKYRGFWVAIAIWSIWAFAPAAITPMFFYCTDTLKMTGLQFSLYNSISTICFLPTTLLFGVLCKHIRLWPLLLVSTVVAIPQWMAVAFVHSPTQAYYAGAFMGLTGGLATTAYFGLLLRACPKALAGTGMLLASGLALLIVELGNVLGGHIYKPLGFMGCAIITTAAYALLFPLCFLLPRALVDPPDDKPVPTEEELVAA